MNWVTGVDKFYIFTKTIYMNHRGFILNLNIMQLVIILSFLFKISIQYYLFAWMWNVNMKQVSADVIEERNRWCQILTFTLIHMINYVIVQKYCI